MFLYMCVFFHICMYICMVSESSFLFNYDTLADYRHILLSRFHLSLQTIPVKMQTSAASFLR